MTMLKNTEINMSRISAKDIAYEKIKEKIIKYLLKPEQPIVNKELENELEISRTPLREALQRLEVEKLIVRNSNGIFSVSSISIKECKELFVMRSKLEGILIRDAIDNLKEEHIEYLSYLTKMVKLNSRLENADTENFGGKFHSTIYSISDNTTVVNTILQLNDRINRYRHLAHKHFVDIKTSSDEHEVILDYMIKRDKVNAELEIEKHIINAMKVAIEALENYENVNN